MYCEAGDLISVPANTTHWFDMGTAPHYVSVRFFHDDDGWVGHFTGSPIAESFATFDQLAGASRAAGLTLSPGPSRISQKRAFLAGLSMGSARNVRFCALPPACDPGRRSERQSGAQPAWRRVS